MIKARIIYSQTVTSLHQTHVRQYLHYTVEAIRELGQCESIFNAVFCDF